MKILHGDFRKRLFHRRAKKAQNSVFVCDWETQRMDDPRSLQEQRNGPDGPGSLRPLESRAQARPSAVL